MNFKKSLQFSAALCFLSVMLVFNVDGQQRARVVKDQQTTQTNQTTTGLIQKTVSSKPVNRPPLIDKIVVIQNQTPQSLIQKTASSKSTSAAPMTSAKRMLYSSVTSSMMINSIQDLYGIPYRYGSTGPNRYDCSGFVWTVFQRSGFSFERSSAANYWRDFEPVEGDERFKFGTLVFFNRLGHIGIVADENGFYHASSSKGITYSPFKGYWEKRVVGFRRIPAQIK